MVVVVTETGVLSITGATPGYGRRVLIGSEVVGGPLPDMFTGVIVNVYSVSGVNPEKGRRTVAPVVVVPVGGEVSIEYEAAYRVSSHIRSTVVSCGLKTVKPVTASGSGGSGRVLMGSDVVESHGPP